MEKEEYTIRKTNPKNGLPKGSWVCFNKTKDKYLQTFGETPAEALLVYLELLTNK